MTVDHVDADQDQAAASQLRPDGGADLALTLGQIGGAGRAAADHVGADVALGRHTVDRAHRLAVHEDDALVALGDLFQEALHHPLLAEGGGEQVEHRAEVRILLRDPEHRRAAMPVQRLHCHRAVLLAERLDLGAVARDQGRRHQFGEVEDEQLLRRVPDLGRIVDHQSAPGDLFQHVGGRDVGHVEGRILAHQHHVDFGEVDALRGPEGRVRALDILHRHRLSVGRDQPALHREPVRRVGVEAVTPRMRFQHQAEGGVARDADRLDRVHLNRDGQRHARPRIAARSAETAGETAGSRRARSVPIDPLRGPEPEGLSHRARCSDAAGGAMLSARALCEALRAPPFRTVTDLMASGRRLSVIVVTRILPTNRCPLRRNAR
ncbi:protein of unknown function [Methylorubrum extorquens]|uniref:Uncharacterized protein n=1 Tax=Methylorubrum extorquens TaxID=408 RepID=A0A2N9AWZ2_METEX|nr:protein of unknown function [Methylorubrum extorquens]